MKHLAELAGLYNYRSPFEDPCDRDVVLTFKVMYFLHFFVLFLVAVCTIVNPFNWHKKMITEDWINLCIHHVHKTGLYLLRGEQKPALLRLLDHNKT